MSGLCFKHTVYFKALATQRLDWIKLARVVPTKCPSKHEVLDTPLVVQLLY